jgi:hypothetical protein
MSRRRRSRRSSSARQRALKRSYIASYSSLLRAHWAFKARRSSGLIFPGIVLFFLAKQEIELGIDLHQHSNDAIDRLLIEWRRLPSSPHFEIVAAASARRKMFEKA